MAKTATVTKTKTATKESTAKKTRRPQADKEDKPKREPSAYQIFVKANMKVWIEANPGRSKEAMAQMALLWKDAPENPNRGKETKTRKPKAPTEKPVTKGTAKTKQKQQKKKVEDDEEEVLSSEQDVIVASSDAE